MPKIVEAKEETDSVRNEHPSSWGSAVCDGSSKSVKLWDWKVLRSREDLGTANESPRIQEQDFHKSLLLIGSTTTSRNFRNAILSADVRNTQIWVVYAASPPDYRGVLTEGETDLNFASRLELGRRKILMVNEDAKDLGIHVETSFVWADSIEEVLRIPWYDKSNFEVVLDVRDIPLESKTSSDKEIQNFNQQVHVVRKIK